MYDCLRPGTDGSAKDTVPSVPLSKLLCQVPSVSANCFPPGLDHVKNTSPLGSHMRDLPREGCKASTPCPFPPHCIGLSHSLPVSFSPPRSSPRVFQTNLSMHGLSQHVGSVGHNRSTWTKARLNRRQKNWKVCEAKSSCVLGKDIAMDRVVGLLEKALVGKLSEWILGCWKPIVGYSPRFSLLSNH